MACLDEANATDLRCGPKPGVSYPLKIAYCGECSMPVEYCEFGPSAEKCKQWLQQNLPEVFEEMFMGEDGDGDGTDEGKKRQKRGGKGGSKPVKKPAEVPQNIVLTRAPRGKNKSVTVICGLTTCGIDLKVASKLFAQKFACGSSVTGPDEIVIQGDVKDDLFDFIPEKWKHVDDKHIHDGGDQKRS